jgi:hypothetical protein
VCGWCHGDATIDPWFGFGVSDSSDDSEESVSEELVWEGSDGGGSFCWRLGDESDRVGVSRRSHGGDLDRLLRQSCGGAVLLRSLPWCFCRWLVGSGAGCSHLPFMHHCSLPYTLGLLPSYGDILLARCGCVFSHSAKLSRSSSMPSCSHLVHSAERMAYGSLL